MTATLFRGLAASGLIASALLAAGGASAQTLEDNRYAGELRACAQRPDDAQRQACAAAVQAKISAERKARIEEQARRRQAN